MLNVYSQERYSIGKFVAGQLIFLAVFGTVD